MPATPDEGRGIKSTRTTFAIVEALHDTRRARLTELADRVGIANSTAHEHLATLQELGYVVEEDGEFGLSLKFLDHGTQAKRRYRDLVEASTPALEGLVAETDETVNLVVEEHGQAVYVDRLTGERGVPTNSWVGKRKPLHAISAGKAILAHLPEDRLEAIVAGRELPPATDRTITAREQLQRELEEIRERGVSFNDRESHDRIRAVGTPIVLDGHVHGAVSVAGPAKRLTGEYFRTEIPDLLLGAVNEIELKLTYR
ncbi:IclR family transcriptional regulator [Natronobeatus ordinarius]|uniref:IclR family transcriptional regulator n=1 Tax=Natronobeatus ordinarius TaxID=2963433 RepID=UPI0020CDE87D|nr:IclR family transcriptional regulator [Natronobeatus ordinarius]